MAKIAETPLMKQYAEMKRKHPDALLLFRVGDFYETFSDDAITASRVLGITLTRRANGKAQHVELAGFPHHALDSYLPKLVRAGFRVAICEQLEDPKLAKKLVKRGITELVTPGLNTSDSLDSRENNFLAGIHFGKACIGIAFLDLGTGEFLCARGDAQYVDKLLNNIAPKEMLRMAGTRQRFQETVTHRAPTFELEDWVYTLQAAEDRLQAHFGTSTLKGFGVDDMPEAVIAAGSLLHYLDQTEHSNISHITSLARIEEEQYVRLDRFTVRNLELVQSMTKEGMSLVDVIDKTSSPAGARLLRRWVLFPLIDTARIRARLDVVDQFFREPDLRDALSRHLAAMGDPERLVGKAATLRINPRELNQLREALLALGQTGALIQDSPCAPLREMAAEIPADANRPLADTIGRTLLPDAPAQMNRGDVIAPGVNRELDDLRQLRDHSKEALDAILRREIEQTGIPSLKISFNNVFGYYIEVRNTHKDRVPADWIRKQTLVSAERYITPELKDYEQKILGAEDRIASIEAEIFRNLVSHVAGRSGEIQRQARVAARIDVLLSYARAAEEYGYVRPEVNDSLKLSVTEGRHPVIERRLPPGEAYVSNSLELDSDSRQIMMITGPNMSGKSAFLRQTALIVLMAQIGSYVPAQAASVGVVDKIFTRVGASDNISLGESTFMVEMIESAAILNNMSPRSLILFDELGRGTSTYDGISIAWSIAEHIHENGACRPKTLFATHYHELNEMERSFPRIVNYNVSVKEVKGKVVFLRKLVPGGSEHSFGIYVARIAGMPPSITRRAEQVLRQLEDDAARAADAGGPAVSRADLENLGASREGCQLSFFQLDDPLLADIRDKILGLDIDNLTPLQALTSLHDLKALITGKPQ